MVDSEELDNVGMPESTQYRTFFLEATSGVSYSLLVERLMEFLGCALEALVFDGVDGSVGASSQFHSSLSYSLECVLFQSFFHRINNYFWPVLPSCNNSGWVMGGAYRHVIKGGGARVSLLALHVAQRM